MNGFPLWIPVAAACFALLLWRVAALRKRGAEARDWVAHGAQLLDVRTADEFDGDHLPGAINIPMSELPKRFSELNPERPVVLYCLSGTRSAHAATILRAHGFKAVLNLGPKAAWPRA